MANWEKRQRVGAHPFKYFALDLVLCLLYSKMKHEDETIYKWGTLATKKCYTLSSEMQQQVSCFWKTHFLNWKPLYVGLTEGNTLARHGLHKWITLKNYLRWTVFYLQSVKVNSQTILKQFQNQWVTHFFNTFLNKLFTC